MSQFQCKYCGSSAASISSLTSNYCSRHPQGSNNRHVLYEGTEKSKYSCKYCGSSASTISSLANNYCSRHPNGANKGRHEPAL